MQYRIKRGQKYYMGGVIYMGGDIITVPDNYPQSKTFEPLIESAAPRVTPQAPRQELAQPPLEEQPKRRRVSLGE